MPEDPSSPTQLHRRWDELASDLGIEGAAEQRTDRLRDDLLARYGESHRHHHDRRHLAEVLAALDELGDQPPSAAVRLAAWFHDAVYAGAAGDDERASADLARGALGDLGLPTPLVERAAAMVEATAGHLVPGDGPPVDPETARLLDADLSILAADTERYDAYAAGIRAEHPDLDDERFRAGRLVALRTLADRGHLFHTPVGRERLEPSARRNLRREIDRLSATAGDG